MPFNLVCRGLVPWWLIYGPIVWNNEAYREILLLQLFDNLAQEDVMSMLYHRRLQRRSLDF